MDSAAALAKLLNHPADFLKYYPVKCAGAGAPNQNAVNLCQYNIDKLSAIGNHNIIGHRGATRPGLFGHQRQISSWILNQGVAMVNGATVNQAHVVPMVNHDSGMYGCLDLHGDVTAMPYYQLDATGDGLMVTGELSNCCFAWAVQGADLWCIHVQPVGGITPNALQIEMATRGRFAGAPHAPLATFGRGDYPVGRASVIGVRQGGTWNLYAQTSNDSFSTISAAYRIHPGAVTRL